MLAIAAVWIHIAEPFKLSSALIETTGNLGYKNIQRYIECINNWSPAGEHFDLIEHYVLESRMDVVDC